MRRAAAVEERVATSNFAFLYVYFTSNRLINDLDVNVFNFTKFGKELPKSHNLSPHSFIQVALQLAYYRSANFPALSSSLPSSKCWDF